MLQRSFLVSLALCLMVHFSAYASPKKNDPKKDPPGRKPLGLQVIELTSLNFAASVGDGNVWLIEFYTPMCHHCKNFSPQYANIAASFHSLPHENVRVAKVDCTSERALSRRFDITSVPSFFVVAGWSVYKFKDDRSETNLMNFVRGGYKKQEPIPFLASPMGPMGLLQGTLVYIGTRLVGMLEWVQASSGVSPVLAAVIICGLGIFGGMVSIVLITILTAPKAKND